MPWLKSRNKPEEFSKEESLQIDFSKSLLLIQAHLALILKAIQEHDSRVGRRLDEISHVTEGFTKINLTRSEDLVKDIPTLIEELLSKTESMSFSQLLEATQVTAPTLSKHLGKLVEEGKVERVETDRIVLYRLRKVNA